MGSIEGRVRIRRLIRPSLEQRPKRRSVLLDMAGKRGANVPRENQCARGRAILEHAAAAESGIVGIGILREIPIRIDDLQQMMENVTRHHRTAAADIELKDEVSR